MADARPQDSMTWTPLNPVLRAVESLSGDKVRPNCPQIRRQGSNQVLHFGFYDIQSEMDIFRPSALLLSYTQTMMAFLLVHPRPRRILMIGLGGGSLLKFCRKHLPGVDLTVVEINPDVIALRSEFQIPPDDQRLRVIQADGAKFVREVTGGSFDVILVDGFYGERMPSSLGSSPFYYHCHRLLTPGGVLACNLHPNDLMYETYRQRMAVIFETGVVFSQCEEVGNCIAFASKGAAFEVSLLEAGHPDRGRPDQISDAIWREIGFAMTCVLARVHETRLGEGMAHRNSDSPGFSGFTLE